MSITKYISLLVCGILIFLLSFESPSLLINELAQRNTEEKEIEEDLDENHLHFANEYLKVLYAGGGTALNATFFRPVIANLSTKFSSLEVKSTFKTQGLKSSFQNPLYILYCSLKLDYC